jgi:hypothetical protein
MLRSLVLFTPKRTFVKKEILERSSLEAICQERESTDTSTVAMELWKSGSTTFYAF